MYCPSCQTKNELHYNYCYYCGYKLKEKDEEPLVPVLEGDYNHTYEDDLLDNDKISDFDITSEMPLRRYQKDKPLKKHKATFMALVSIGALVLVLLTIFFVERGLSLKSRQPNNISQTIAVSSSVEETTKDGEKAYRIIFNTVNGQEVSFLEETLKIHNGRGEFIVKNSDLYSYNLTLTEDEMYEVNIDAIVSAPGLPDSTERISIILKPPYEYAPFKLLNPSPSESQWSGSDHKLVFKTEPGSQILINHEDVSSLLSEDGRFEKAFTLSEGQDELVLDIRVSTSGCLDNIQQIIFKSTAMEVPITINEESPILSDEEWIKVSGTIPLGASIDADRDIFEEPDINEETGAFSLYVRAIQPGYTPCILTAKLEDKTTSTELILERKTTVDSYTSTAWKADYNELQRDVQLNNGRHFAFKGTIKDIIETGRKTAFTISIDGESNVDHFFYVEFWGDFNYVSGDTIRVFGNRWGNKDDVPRFLAKYLYD